MSLVTVSSSEVQVHFLSQALKLMVVLILRLADPSLWTQCSSNGTFVMTALTEVNPDAVRHKTKWRATKLSKNMLVLGGQQT